MHKYTTLFIAFSDKDLVNKLDQIIQMIIGSISENLKVKKWKKPLFALIKLSMFLDQLWVIDDRAEILHLFISKYFG